MFASACLPVNNITMDNLRSEARHYVYVCIYDNIHWK
jgi:hypothetical protein